MPKRLVDRGGKPLRHKAFEVMPKSRIGSWSTRYRPLLLATENECRFLLRQSRMPAAFLLRRCDLNHHKGSSLMAMISRPFPTRGIEKGPEAVPTLPGQSRGKEHSRCIGHHGQHLHLRIRDPTPPTNPRLRPMLCRRGLARSPINDPQRCASKDRRRGFCSGNE